MICPNCEGTGRDHWAPDCSKHCYCHNCRCPGCDENGEVLQPGGFCQWCTAALKTALPPGWLVAAAKIQASMTGESLSP